MRFEELVPILQAAIGPVILISGAGLLLLSMTNRFARVVDRSRQLGNQRGTGAGTDHQVESQLEILARRARLLRAAISFLTLSVLLAAVLVIALFLTAMLHVQLVVLSATLFIACLLSLIVSLVLFLQDINLSLAALKLELASRHGPS